MLLTLAIGGILALLATKSPIAWGFLPLGFGVAFYLATDPFWDQMATHIIQPPVLPNKNEDT